MALLDFLKKKEETEKARKTERTQKVSTAKPKAESKPKESAKPAVKTELKKGKFSFEAIKQPHISEKSSILAEKNQYVFRVVSGYNKKELKNAIEGIYNVNVLSVNMIKIPPKKRRLGRTEGFKKAYTKAIVKVKEGQKIEII